MAAANDLMFRLLESVDSKKEHLRRKLLDGLGLSPLERQFLADCLAGKIRKAQGRPRNFQSMADLEKAVAIYRAVQKEGGKVDSAIEAVARNQKISKRTAQRQYKVGKSWAKQFEKWDEPFREWQKIFARVEAALKPFAHAAERDRALTSRAAKK